MMFGLFNQRNDQAVFGIYNRIVAQSRQEHFYKTLSVPDTVDGRYDMIVLHLVLLFHRFQSENKNAVQFGQDVFDLFFKDMDRNLREMGVTDTVVPKKVKKMVEAFYGRAQVYRSALEAGDSQALSDALSRNIYVDSGDAGAVEALTAYVFKCFETLKTQSAADIIAGDILFPNPVETEIGDRP